MLRESEIRRCFRIMILTINCNYDDCNCKLQNRANTHARRLSCLSASDAGSLTFLRLQCVSASRLLPFIVVLCFQVWSTASEFLQSDVIEICDTVKETTITRISWLTKASSHLFLLDFEFDKQSRVDFGFPLFRPSL